MAKKTEEKPVVNPTTDGTQGESMTVIDSSVRTIEILIAKGQIDEACREGGQRIFANSAEFGFVTKTKATTLAPIVERLFTLWKLAMEKDTNPARVPISYLSFAKAYIDPKGLDGVEKDSDARFNSSFQYFRYLISAVAPKVAKEEKAKKDLAEATTALTTKMSAEGKSQEEIHTAVKALVAPSQSAERRKSIDVEKDVVAAITGARTLLIDKCHIDADRRGNVDVILRHMLYKLYDAFGKEVKEGSQFDKVCAKAFVVTAIEEKKVSKKEAADALLKNLK